MARLRPALLVAGALAVTGATAASPETTALTVSVRPGTPTPDPEDSNRLGRRGWDVPFEITVSGAPCSEPDVRYAYRILFNRRTTDTYAADAEATARPGMFSASAGVQLPGSVVWFTATARCSPGDVPVAAEARVRVPPRTCDAGPIPVRALRGRAMREDFNRINRLVPLAKGDLVVTAYDFRVASGARLVLGEPACNGLLYRIDGPAPGGAGSYDGLGRGDFFSVNSGRVLARGDRHAGGVFGGSASAQPLGERPSTYELVVEPAAGAVRPRTRIRVLRGAVLVRPLASPRSLILRAGSEVRVSCPGETQCAAGRPRRVR